VLRIGIVHGFVGGGGGTEKTLNAILDALVEKNHDVHMYTFSKPAHKIPSKIHARSTLPFVFPYLGIYQRYIESRLIKKTQNEPIVIQASGGISLPYDDKQRLIIYCHSDFQDELGKDVTKYKGVWEWYYRPYARLIKQFLQQINAENIHLIANSQFTQDSIRKRFGKQSTVISPPVSLAEFAHKTSKKPQVVTLSRYSQEKNLEFAIHTMKGLDATHMVIGNTKTKSNILYYDKLQTISHSNTVLLKDLSRRDLVQKLQESKVYFHASEETFGISVVESIAAGCIPIVPDNSAHRETVQFKELRYVPYDIEDAQAKVKSALSGAFDGLLEQLQDNVQKYDVANFKRSFVEFIDGISS
jgi:glycosyltransferase involved in cell wall biosynthesis